MSSQNVEVFFGIYTTRGLRRFVKVTFSGRRRLTKVVVPIRRFVPSRLQVARFNAEFDEKVEPTLVDF
jgi:hypothetical protein